MRNLAGLAMFRWLRDSIRRYPQGEACRWMLIGNDQCQCDVRQFGQAMPLSGSELELIAVFIHASFL
jgi:hypothetical protein